jgi:quercetin dioxygenase-like cupin family protein
MPHLPVHTRILGLGAALALIGPLAFAQQRGEQRVTPAEVAWPAAAGGAVGTSGVSGIQTVVLKGDPTKRELYTLLLRVGPHTRIAAHAHQDDRVATVLSGTWYFGYGKELQEASLKALPPGSVYTEPPNVDHFAVTKDEPVVVQITGMGPSATAYVDPRNDPTRK